MAKIITLLAQIITLLAQIVVCLAQKQNNSNFNIIFWAKNATIWANNVMIWAKNVKMHVNNVPKLGSITILPLNTTFPLLFFHPLIDTNSPL